MPYLREDRKNGLRYTNRMEAAAESQLNALRRAIAGVRGPVRAALPAAPPLAMGLLLRLWMFKELFQVNGDTLVYGGLAKNLLLHGRYALTVGSGETYPTLIRLPGYPLFLALCFRLFGMENYASAVYVQIALELLGCLLLASFVRRIARPGAALATLWLAALCPFTASYAASPLAETPTLFLLALALWSMARFHARPGWGSALWFTFAVTYAALLRPDGALVAVALAPALMMRLRREKLPSGAKARVNFIALTARLKSCPVTKPAFSASGNTRPENAGLLEGLKSAPFADASFSADQQVPRTGRMVLVCVLLALTPFAVWTGRNWHVFHVFQPLAPRLATDPDESPRPGWERWVKTWCLDFVSTYDIYWNVPGDTLDWTKLPRRAFDSPAQRAETAALAEEYNRGSKELTAGLDARFARLAEERVAAHPLRFYLWLPMGRLGDMWLRPRVENLPIDLDWWVYAHHRAETRFSWAYAGLNALYLLLGIAGLCLRPRFWPWMLAYLLLRSALLLTVQAPEARYTLECFPILFAAGGIALYWTTVRVWRSVSNVKALLGRG
jgi:hypothetical protein